MFFEIFSTHYGVVHLSTVYLCLLYTNKEDTTAPIIDSIYYCIMIIYYYNLYNYNLTKNMCKKIAMIK
jgi:hypothetical protein